MKETSKEYKVIIFYTKAISKNLYRQRKLEP